MAVTTRNVMVGLATMWFAPLGATTAPATPPADTVAKGASWGATWKAVGATEQGVKLTVDHKTTDITIEEQSTPALVTIDSTSVTLAVTLSEDTLTNMQLAYGGGAITVTAPGTTQVGKSTLVLANSLTKLSVGFEAVNKFGFWRRMYVPIVLSSASVDTAYRRAAQQRLYPVTMRAICTPGTIKITEMTANHT